MEGGTDFTTRDVTFQACGRITADERPDGSIKQPFMLVSLLPPTKDKYLCPDGIVQELCESRGGRPGLSVLTSLLVSVDVKNY